jgi:hypothetical protein
MKKNILKVVTAGVFLIAMSLNFTVNVNSITKKANTDLLSVGQKAKAICREYYGKTFVCCLGGGGNCTNAVNNEYYGPVYFY